MRNGNYGTRYTEGIRNQTAISKKKKKMVSTYIRARFGPISPKSKHEKSDQQKSLHRLHGLEFFVEYTKFSKIAKGILRKKRLKSTDLNNALLCSDG